MEHTEWTALEKEPESPKTTESSQESNLAESTNDSDELHITHGSQKKNLTDQTDLSDELDVGLAKLDPLSLHPRMSSIVLCIVFAGAFLGIACGVYWLGVHTTDGQSYEDLAITNFSSNIPWFANLQSWLIVAIAIVLGIVALVVASIRRRWWLIGQLAVYAIVVFAAGKLLKPLLPRPLLVYTESSSNNSAPSGHTMLAVAVGLILVAAVPHAWRAVCAVISSAFEIIVGISVIYDQWHRPSDVVMAIFIAGGCMMLMLACTHASGMDRTGDRVSSPSIQIVATALITLGICAIAYAVYIVWQVYPGLQYASSWAAPGVCAASAAMVSGSALLVNGMVLMMRQLTAAPLTKLGLIGAPPTPPRTPTK